MEIYQIELLLLILPIAIISALAFWQHNKYQAIYNLKDYNNFKNNAMSLYLGKNKRKRLLSICYWFYIGYISSILGYGLLIIIIESATENYGLMPIGCILTSLSIFLYILLSVYEIQFLSRLNKAKIEKIYLSNFINELKQYKVSKYYENKSTVQQKLRKLKTIDYSKLSNFKANKLLLRIIIDLIDQDKTVSKIKSWYINDCSNKFQPDEYNKMIDAWLNKIVQTTIDKK